MSTEKRIGATIVRKTGNYAVISLDRPGKMNALNPDLFDGILRAVREIRTDDDIRCVVLTGSGDHFSAGGDVQEDIVPLKDKSLEEFKAYFKSINELYVELYELKKTTIAAINGYALGAGFDLTLCCDIRIAADNSKMGEYFVRMGLVPETGTYLLPKIVGSSQAKMICLTGKTIESDEALKIGLVDQVVPSGDLLTTAEKLARQLSQGPASVSLINEAINTLGQMPLKEAIEHAVMYQFTASRTLDHKEAVEAFLEKRKPVFKGK